MSQIPAELKYVKSHEWVKLLDDGSVVIGITDHAQQALGDLVFVELPDLGRSLALDESCAVVESVKAASDVYAPLSGEVTAINEALTDAPETLNQDPYGEGWMWKQTVADPAELEGLLDAAGYEKIASEG